MQREQRKQSRREFLKFTALTAAAGAFAACAPAGVPATTDSGSEAGSSASGAEAVTLSMISPTFNEEMIDLFQNQFAPAFQEENPDVTFEFTATDYSRINDQLLAAFAAGQGPDLWEHGSAASGAGWAASGQALALDEYWATYDRKDDYLANAVETAYLDGKLYSIPRRMNPSTLFYRKDFFEEAGIAAPAEPWSWEDHLAAAEALTVRENGTVTRAGHSTPTQSWDGIQRGWWHYLYQNGASILTPDLDETAFNTPEGIEAIQWYHDLLWEHELDVLGGIATGLTGIALNVGTAAMGYAGLEVLIEARNNFPDVAEQLGIMAPTTRNRPATLLAVDRIFISKDSEADTAWAWLTFLHRPENLLARYELSGDMPATQSFIDSETVAADPLLQQLLQLAEYGYQWPPSPKWNEFRSFMTSMSEAALTDPGPVEASVNQFAQEINAVLSS